MLLVGGGGREHALAWALSRSSLVDRLICAPGNPGTAEMGECHPVGADDLAGLGALATDERVDLVVVGPEVPLVRGLADLLVERGIRVFGPGRAGARLEGSKSWAKSLMKRKGIPTAEGAAFDRCEEALDYVKRLGAPLVVKADGLAAGKGVTVCDDLTQARTAVEDAMGRGVFGEAGRRVVIEERLEGEELSIIAFCDGKTILAMPPAQDFKRANDGDRGPNTGGMGSVSPVPACTEAVFGKVLDEILEPVVAALEEEAEPYVGVIYGGIMLCEGEPRVLEFNCRFGDPETQALLPRLEGDLAEVIVASTEGALAGVRLRWRDQACVAVVAASKGYPGPCRTGLPISGMQEAASRSGLPVFHAGTALGPEGELVTAGGRVATVSALGADHAEASRRAYAAIREISFEGIRYRSDIGARICGSGPARSRL